MINKKGKSNTGYALRVTIFQAAEQFPPVLAS
jgi:hypothetical protein